MCNATGEDDPITTLNALPPQQFDAAYISGHFADLLKLKRNGAFYTISPKAVSVIEQNELDQCFQLLEVSSKEDYRNSSKGWKPNAKKREMKEEGMWYLLVRQSSDISIVSDAVASPILAFLSFMLTYEDDHPVSYIYEIHLASQVRRLGIGSHLFKLCEQISRQTGAVEKMMLSVFTRNTIAVEFYKIKLEFEVDEFSPREKRLRGGIIKTPDYEILSKSIERNDTPDKAIRGY